MESSIFVVITLVAPTALFVVICLLLNHVARASNSWDKDVFQELVRSHDKLANLTFLMLLGSCFSIIIIGSSLRHPYPLQNSLEASLWGAVLVECVLLVACTVLYCMVLSSNLEELKKGTTLFVGTVGSLRAITRDQISLRLGHEMDGQEIIVPWKMWIKSGVRLGDTIKLCWIEDQYDPDNLKFILKLNKSPSSRVKQDEVLAERSGFISG